MTNEIDSEIIKNDEDMLTMLDNLLEKRENDWWNEFYSKKDRPVPFFKNIPDENLVSYIDSGFFKPGKVLDVGCGNGRNSIYLAKKGFDVDGIDFSETSIKTAKETANLSSTKVNFICKSIFDFENDGEKYDYIYDSGCFHHIKPHRRSLYLNTILKNLKPEGAFGMACFNLKGGSNISDYDVYRDSSMHGGIGFSEYKLKIILEEYFDIIEFREMKESCDDSIMGIDILWTVLMKMK
jgi:2-polyprenyl-3-methyl-5-hydroxy-6-metoxy-1,4-benzoquinol methylase